MQPSEIGLHIHTKQHRVNQLSIFQLHILPITHKMNKSQGTQISLKGRFSVVREPRGLLVGGSEGS